MLATLCAASRVFTATTSISLQVVVEHETYLSLLASQALVACNSANGSHINSITKE
jgi:hypothetical protein